MNVIKEETPRICRVCINEVEVHGKCFNLFDRHEDLLIPDPSISEILLVDKLRACANVRINEADGLPDRICSNCLLELENAFSFRRKCEKSDDILRIAASNYMGNKDESETEFENECYDENTAKQHVIQVKSEYTLSEEGLKSQNIQEQLQVKTESEHVSDFELSDEEANQTCEDNIKVNCASLPVASSKPDIKDTQQTKPMLQIKQADEIVVKKSKAVDLKLECHDCGNLFKSKCKMRVHWKKEHNKYTCPHCKLLFKSWKAYNKHQKNRSKTCIRLSNVRIESEGTSLIYYCKYCEYSSKRRDGVLNHIETHIRDYKYKCNLCDKSYFRSVALKAHKERAHKQFFGQKTCHVCGIVFLGFTAFQGHMRKHRKKNIPCNVCNKSFATLSCLAVHKKLHSDVKAFACDKCPKKFRTLGSLCTHKNTHGDKKHACKFCGYKLKCPYKIKRHEKEHNPSNVACLICGRFFVNNAELDMHMKLHIERKHPCEHCDRKYALRKSLTEHLRQYHGIYVSSEGKNGFKTTKKSRKKRKLSETKNVSLTKAGSGKN